MIDTLRLMLSPSCSWRPAVEISDSWDLKESLYQQREFRKKLKASEVTNGGTYLAVHKETGLRVMGNILCPTKLEVSLPRVIHGKNGLLIKDEAEFTAAFCALHDLLEEVISVDFDRRKRGEWLFFDSITRIDLVWQFRGDINSWNQAFRLCGHPNVRKPTAEHRGSGLVFPGASVMVRIYDKLYEVCRKRGDVVRVEVQLRGKWLNELGLRQFDSVMGGGWSRLWSLYKDFILKFNPSPRDEVNTVAELLVLLEARGIALNDQSVFEVWAAGKSRASVCRMRSKMKESLPSRMEIDLWDLTAVPVPVELEYAS